MLVFLQYLVTTMQPLSLSSETADRECVGQLCVLKGGKTGRDESPDISKQVSQCLAVSPGSDERGKNHL